MSRLFPTVAVLALLAASQAVQASATYSFSTTAGSSTCGSFTTSCYGNTRAYTATESVSGSAISLTVKAYSNTGTASSAGTNSNAALQDAYLGYYSGSGLGIVNRDQASSAGDTYESTAPEHALDNNQRYDMALLSFGKSVTLSALSVGYAPYDSDLSVWAYVGSGTPVLDGATYAAMLSSSSGLVSSGWVVVGNYADASTGSEAINASKISSSYWLIGAYNPAGTAASCGSTSSSKSATGTAGDLDCGDDYIKLMSVSIADQSTPTTEVPEPASLLLTGLALAGIAAQRKFRK